MDLLVRPSLVLSLTSVYMGSFGVLDSRRRVTWLVVGDPLAIAHVKAALAKDEVRFSWSTGIGLACSSRLNSLIFGGHPPSVAKI